MEEVQSLTEDLRLMIHLDPKPLTGVHTTEALLQLLLDIVWGEEPYRGSKSMLHSRFPKVLLAIFSYRIKSAGAGRNLVQARAPAILVLFIA